MVIARQLHQLQEIDAEIESRERALRQKESLIGANQAVTLAQSSLREELQKLEELQHRQHSAEWEIDDLQGKIKAAEDKLYSGKINNPKELSGLQQDVNVLKANRDQLETKALELMDRVEAAEAGVAAARHELARVEADYRAQQQQLADDVGQLKHQLEELGNQRGQVLSTIDQHAVASYEKLRKLKGQAVARVEQGICRGCRISLTSSELQQVRSGNLIQCGSCGRILYLP